MGSAPGRDAFRGGLPDIFRATALSLPAPASAHAGRVLAGEPAALLEQLAELAECGVEHLVLEFLAADGRDLDAQLTTFAERVRPRLA